MMLRYSFNLDKEADAIENAVRKVLEDGYRTTDLLPKGREDNFTLVGCRKMGDLLVERISNS
jgi:3-isopropylmalate dehydrogenase